MKNKNKLKSIAHKIMKCENRMNILNKEGDEDSLKKYQKIILDISSELTFEEMLYIDEYISKQNF
jgi:hypothetical protein